MVVYDFRTDSSFGWKNTSLCSLWKLVAMEAILVEKKNNKKMNNISFEDHSSYGAYIFSITSKEWSNKSLCFDKNEMSVLVAMVTKSRPWIEIWSATSRQVVDHLSLKAFLHPVWLLWHPVRKLHGHLVRNCLADFEKFINTSVR